MRLETTQDMYQLLSAHTIAAAFGTALERGLFWLVSERALDAVAIAEALSIPPGRCRYWLELLREAKLLETRADGYVPTAAARHAILDAHSRETWAFLAEEARHRMPAFVDLASRIQTDGPAAHGLSSYVEQMIASTDQAARFTRMLAELHGGFAEQLAAHLELGNARRLMDLGGGSGVVALALLRKHADLEAVVVDIANVCAAGRAIASETPVADRIRYHAADFSKDALPSGFDVVIECDVGVYGEPLLTRIRDSLEPGGRLVIVDQLAPAPGVAPPAKISWAFTASLENPDFSHETADGLTAQLARVGFEPTRREMFRTTWTLIEARRRER